MIRRFLLLVFFSCAILSLHAQNITGKWEGSITQVNYYTGATYPYKLELDFNTVSGKQFTAMAYFYNSTDYAYMEITGTFDGKTLDVQTSRLIKWKIQPNYQWCTIKGKLTYSESGGYAWLNGNSFGRGFNTGDACDMDIIKVKKPAPQTPKKDSVTTKPVVQKTEPKKDSVIVKQKIEPIVSDTAVKQVVVHNQNPENPKTNEDNGKIVIGKKAVEDIYGRKPKTGKVIEVSRSKVKIRVSDNATVDGDSISLYFNEDKLLDNVALTHNARTITIDVQDGDETVNAVILFAENLGRTPPNTALVEIDDGDRKQTLNLESDLDRCDIIYLRMKK